MKQIIAFIAAFSVVIAAASAADHKVQSLIQPGVTFTIPDNTTTNLPAAVRSDAGLWANPDGSTALAAVVVSITGTNAAATNTFTFTLKSVADGSTVSTEAIDTFSVTLKANGTTAATLSTNVTTAAIQGAKALRLATVATDNVGSDMGGYTVSAKLVGFVP